MQTLKFSQGGPGPSVGEKTVQKHDGGGITDVFKRPIIFVYRYLNIIEYYITNASLSKSKEMATHGNKIMLLYICCRQKNLPVKI